MKRIFVAIMIVFSLSFLFGFTTKPEQQENDDFIMLSLDFSSNGQIVQSIDFSVNSDRINNESVSLKEALDFKAALIKEVETLRNEFLFSYALKYLENPIEEYKINKGVLLTAVSFDEDDDTVGFKMGFSSINAWNYYHQTKENDSENDNKQKSNKNIFLNKIESKGIFPFSAQMQDEGKTKTVGERYKERYLSAASGLSFYEKLSGMYQPVFIYNYSSFNSKLRSDSDYTFTDESGHLHHLWLSEEKDLKNDSAITLYFYSIEKGNWLILTLGILLSIMALSIIVIKLKEKGKVKKSIKSRK